MFHIPSTRQISEGQTDILFDGENPYVGSIVSNKTVSSWGYFTIGTTNNTPLPVRLIDFTASLIGKEKAMIQWISLAGEGGVDHFVIEKSRDAKNFIPVGYMKSAGHSIGEVSYTVIDNKVYDGRSYYRLRQVSIDNTFEYSPIATAMLELDVPFSVTKAFPNPADEYFSIEMDVKTLQDMRVAVYNMTGSIVEQYNISVIPGKQTIKIDTGRLSQGLYHLRIGENGQAETIRFSIER